MPSATLPSPTTAEPDHVLAYRLGNLTWILAWILTMAGLCYALAAPTSPLRLPILGVVTATLIADLTASLIRSFRRRASRSDASIIADPGARADERQRHLRLKAQRAAGLAMYGFAILLFFFGIAAGASGIRIDSPDRWIDLTYTISMGLVSTYIVALKVASRYFSRNS